MADRPLSPSGSTPSPRRSAPARGTCESRCLCGSLLARLIGDQVELKCRRCKRTTLIPLSGGRAD